MRFEVEREQKVVCEVVDGNRKILERCIFDFPPNSNLMRRQVNQDNMSRVYREFSRQRYTKYRSQFPRLREAELVVKIIKEWEHMDCEHKQQLAAEYIKKNYIKEDHQPGSNHSSTFKTPTKSEKFRFILMATDKSKLAPSTAKTDERLKKFLEDDDEIPFYSDRMEGEYHSSHSSQSVEVMQSSKRSSHEGRTKKQEYISFYKFYYKKLAREHQKWGAAKITNIIRMLWKRQKKTSETIRTKKIREPKVKTIKKASAYQAFKHLKLKESLTAPEARTMWKRLPIETRNKWQQSSKGEISESYQFRCSTIRFGNPISLQPSCQNMEYMHKFIDI